MKINYVIYLTLLMPLLCNSYPSKNNDNDISKTTKSIDKSITVEDSDHADSEPAEITKRSGGGSFDFISHIKSSLLGGIGKASASSSSGSSGSGYKSNDYGHHGNSVDFDPWTLKKSVLNTLFQAVKAITGGVTAIKGQLIKGSGYVLSGTGKLVAASGDKVTDLGKSIVHSAQLVPNHGGGGHGGGGHGGGGLGGYGSFGKFSSLSGGSSGHSSSGPGHSGHAGPAVHSETITQFDIPHGHTHYGPPSKPPSSFGPATHQYLPPGGYVASFEGPEHYGYQIHEENIKNPNEISIHYHHYHIGHTDTTNPYDYGQKQNSDLTDSEAKRAENALNEIIHLLPLTIDNKYTGSKTNYESNSGGYDLTDNNNDLQNSYYYESNKENESPQQLGPIESISITESLTHNFGVDQSQPPQSSEYSGTEHIHSEHSSKEHNSQGFDGYTYFDKSQPPKTSDISGIKHIHSEHPPKQYNPHSFDVYQAMADKYKSQSHSNIETSQKQQQSYKSQIYNNSPAPDIGTIIAALEPSLSHNYDYKYNYNDQQGSYSSKPISPSLSLAQMNLNSNSNYYAKLLAMQKLDPRHRQQFLPPSRQVPIRFKSNIDLSKSMGYQYPNPAKQFKRRRIFI